MRSTPLRTKGLLEAASCAVVLALGISFAQTTSTQSQVVTLPVDRGPEGVAFDGVNIWIANSVGNTVTKLRASDEAYRSEEHTSELQSRLHLVCRLLLEKKKPNKTE